MQLSITQFFIVVGISVLVGVSFIVSLLLLPPSGFSSSTVRIASGSSISQAANKLAEQDIIIHPKLLSVPLRVRDQSITAGRYKFSTALSPLAVANRLSSGEFQTEQQKIVIPEGFTREEIADRLNQKIKDFSRDAFLQETRGQEGYLFPDTYQFSNTMSESEIADLMRENFREQIDTLRSEMRQFSHSQDNVIKMASLVVREAADYQTRRRVAGVLWSRLEQGMPLQVDAVFSYLLNKASSELTQDDLDLDSPYNLYENTGLPPQPIANPGLDAIQATINPLKSEDLYYLTGDSGDFYFSETLEEHKRNKKRYINQK